MVPACCLPCSATWPREVKNIASQFVTNQTVHVFIGGVEDKLVANKAITQRVRVSVAGKCGRCGVAVAKCGRQRSWWQTGALHSKRG